MSHDGNLLLIEGIDNDTYLLDLRREQTMAHDIKLGEPLFKDIKDWNLYGNILYNPQQEAAYLLG